jgi:hypothetical protein
MYAQLTNWIATDRKNHMGNMYGMKMAKNCCKDMFVFDSINV